jgi:thiamine monophosphate synthase
LYALANIVETINNTFRALQGKQLLLDVQKQHLKKLQQELMQIGGIGTGGVKLQNIPGVSQLGCFQVSMASVESFC